ncbi:MAG: adenylate/guanylate cyclase domain-containing protein [Deltaproteobacteria bacterium]|nr:MAG: adenylate/guanylate cyclase domain-containing protein [Deltaproteobacteria bacterium]
MSQGLAILYGVTCLAVPQLRADYFSPSARPGAVFCPQFYLFAVPLGLALGLAGVAIVQVFRTEPDPSEGLRLNAMALATPFLLTGFFAASSWRPVTTGIGEVVFLAGAIRYHVLQGQRGQFLARFLSPQVARLVRERGLPATMQQSRIQLSVVACDLRGFTPFAESAAPEEVMELLREYYDTIGAVVSAFGGTVKDLAGDGILCLVGAPIPYADHARRAVDMSLRMRERGGEVLSRWRAMGLDLGLGIGVASGYVTVGVLGGSERLEYAAVGPPVNLAARLCARAESGQILVDQRTVGLVGGSDRSRFERLAHEETLKGLSRPVVIHELTS